MKWLINMRVRNGRIVDKCNNEWQYSASMIAYGNSIIGGGDTIQLSTSQFCHTINNIPIVWAGSPYTIAFWTYLTSANGGYGNILFGGGNIENNMKGGEGPNICPRQSVSKSTAMWPECGTNNSSYWNSTASYISSSWRHIAVTRDENHIVRCFVDGNCVVTLNRSGATYALNKVYINDGYKFNNDSKRHSYGYIDDICLISGKALWTENFTPPQRYLEDTLRNHLIENNDNMYGIQKQSE